MRTFPPAPKCPVHDVFMRFRSGTHPDRFYFCPLCRDHWRENGASTGPITLVPAFRSSLPAPIRTEPTAIIRHVPEPCARPHIGPVVGTLAVVGGLVILGALLSAARPDE